MTYSPRSLVRHTPLLALVLATGFACGGKETDRPSSVVGGSGGLGSQAIDEDRNLPVVELSLRDGEADLDTPAEGAVTAVCKVTPGNEDSVAAIDASSVKFVLFDAAGAELEEQAGATVMDSEDEYEAEFPVEALESDLYRVECRVSTVGETPFTSSAEVTVAVDAGPTIEMVSPVEASALGAGTPQTFVFAVTPSKIADDDPGAVIDTVVLKVKDQEFPATIVPGTTDQYSVEIDFSDTTAFPDLPDGELLFTVEATNSRERSATSTLSTNVLLDGVGPVIAINSPNDGHIIGGTVELVFNVSDLHAGLDPETIVVTLNDNEHRYNATNGQWTVDGTEVTFTFESATVTGSSVQTALEIAARDAAGNDASLVTATYFRDEKPPIVSLDPPMFRARKTVGAATECSHAFNPVGDSPTSGVIPDAVRFRSVVWDETNTVTGQDVDYFSTTDRGRVELWIRPAGEGPILRDSTGSGTCDDIVTADELSVSKNLQAVTSPGQTFYGTSDTDPSALPTLVGCEYGASTTPPSLMCSENSELSVALHQKFGSTKEPALYGLPQPGASECTGGNWEIASSLPNYEGWICVAARAYDEAGNRGVSRPVALCLDKTGGEVPQCLSELGSPPDCTGTCGAPKAFPASGVIYAD